MLTKEEIAAFKEKKIENKYKDVFSSKDMISKANELEKKLARLKTDLDIFDHDLKEEKKQDSQMHIKTFE